jgi:hypothetical protein
MLHKRGKVKMPTIEKIEEGAISINGKVFWTDEWIIKNFGLTRNALRYARKIRRISGRKFGRVWFNDAQKIVDYFLKPTPGEEVQQGMEAGND